MLDRLWAHTVTGNWDQKSLKAARLMMVGTNNRARCSRAARGSTLIHTRPADLDLFFETVRESLS
jgi:hypothetical protein